ncbi:MAG: PilZ domain-containing protein [Desulfobulbia bacterium]
MGPNGMLMLTNDIFNVGEKLNIDFQFRHGQHQMRLEGEVVRIAHEGVGIKFL